MSARTTFEAIGDFLYGLPFEFYDNVGNYVNYSLLILGFIGLFYWLNLQRKFDNRAKNDPNQIQ